MHKTNTDSIFLARQLLEVARLAPSVHNVQPWYFTLNGAILELHISAERRLHAGDPTMRELWISMGIMFETIIQAATALGITIEIRDTQTTSLKKPIATIALISTNQGYTDKTALQAIKKRYTHRGSLSDKPVEPSVIKNLQNIPGITQLKGVEVLATDDRNHIELASKLTKQGLGLAFSSNAFRHELSQLIHPNWTRLQTGLPGFVLNKGTFGALWEKWSLRFNLDNTSKAKLEARRVQKAPLLLFIATTGDVPAHWFNAGRAYMLTALELTHDKLLHSTLAAPIEATDLHEELEAVLGTKLRLQCMLIVGYPTHTKKQPRTPRLSVDEILTLK